MIVVVVLVSVVVWLGIGAALYKTTYKQDLRNKGLWGILGYYHWCVLADLSTYISQRWRKRQVKMDGVGANEVPEVGAEAVHGDQMVERVAADVADATGRAQFPDVAVLEAAQASPSTQLSPTNNDNDADDNMFMSRAPLPTPTDTPHT
jgi:hypothetical protein